jgi:hypothetical protein
MLREVKLKEDEPKTRRIGECGSGSSNPMDSDTRLTIRHTHPDMVRLGSMPRLVHPFSTSRQ